MLKDRSYNHEQTDRDQCRGFTLIEMLVSVALFSVLILITVAIFQAVTQGQRHVIAAQNVQETVYFALEVMSKEIRTAYGAHSGSPCADDGTGSFGGIGYYKTFNVEGNSSDQGSELWFRNKDNQCVRYFLENDSGVSRLKIQRDSQEYFITPDDIEVHDLDFYIVDDRADDFHSLQPRVTIKMTVEAADPQSRTTRPVELETTVSSRYYE